jgi:hypothetical protein
VLFHLIFAKKLYVLNFNFQFRHIKCWRLQYLMFNYWKRMYADSEYVVKNNRSSTILFLSECTDSPHMHHNLYLFLGGIGALIFSYVLNVLIWMKYFCRQNFCDLYFFSFVVSFLGSFAIPCLAHTYRRNLRLIGSWWSVV